MARVFSRGRQLGQGLPPLLPQQAVPLQPLWPCSAGGQQGKETIFS